MVQILPRFDPGGEVGAALGRGTSQALSQHADHSRMGKALDSLNNINDEELKKMSLPQQMKTFMKPFVGLPGGNMMISEMMPKILEYLQNLSDIEPEGGENKYPADFTDAQKSVYDASKYSEKVSGDENNVNSSETPTQQNQSISGENIDPEPITKVGPSRKGLPNNMPGEVRELAKTFPDIQAMSLRGNPQGLSFDDQVKYTNTLTRRNVPRETAVRRVADLNNYLKTQAESFQNIQDLVTKEAQAIYGGTPLYEMFQRQMQKEAENQIDAGRMEQNSVVNAARQRGKSIETIINNAHSVKGRPMFEFGVEDRQNSSKNWISPLVKKGEIQPATELLMQNKLPKKDGSSVPGPDWGPVRATEIVQSQIPGDDSIKRAKRFTKSLPNLQRKLPSLYGETPYHENQRIKKLSEIGLKKLEDYMADPKQFKPTDSLVLLRSYAKDQGYDEPDFRKALEAAKSRREGEFSERQNWEESTLLPYDVRPSLTEILQRKRTVTDLFERKK